MNTIELPRRPRHRKFGKLFFASVVAVARRRYSLRAYLFGLSAISLVPALGLGALASISVVRDLRASFETRLADGAAAGALALDHRIDTYRAVLDTLSMATALDPPDLDPARMAILHMLASRVAIQMGAPILLFLRDRTAFSTHQPYDQPAPPAAAPQALEKVFATKRALLGNLVMRPSAPPLVPLMVPVIRNDVVVAVLATQIRLDSVGTVLAATRPSNGEFISLVDGSGAMVARSPDRGAVGRQIGEWQREAASSGLPATARGVSLIGQSVIIASHPLRTAPGWTVNVGGSAATYEALLWPVYGLLIGGGVVLLLAIIMSLRMAQRIIRPVRGLTIGAERLASGDTSLPSKIIPTSVKELHTMQDAIERAEVRLVGHVHAAKASEARLRAVMDTALDAIMVIDDQGIVCEYNRGAEEMFGWQAAEVIGQNIKMLMPAFHATEHDDHLARYRSTGAMRKVGAISEIEGQRKDGSRVPLEAAIGEWRDGAGRRHFTGVLRDITMRHAAQDRQRILSDEVDHRSKNLLAVVQAVLRLSRADTVPQYVAAVSERINAMARAHTLLSQEGWEGVSLRHLAERELAAFLRDDALSGSLRGPDVTLLPLAVQPMTMVIHELATNAAKYGALSRAGGRLELAWRLDATEGVLCLRWNETGSASLAPTKNGFGLRLIDNVVRHQLGGSVRREWEPTGLMVEMRIPQEWWRSSTSTTLILAPAV